MGWATALWLALVCCVALFLGLFTLAPVDKTEALQIGIAETMLRLHEWVVPQWNGHLYADKPPLPYWLAMVLWHWFGLTPELARLPAAICASLGVAVIAWLLQRVARRELPASEAWLRAALAGTLLALSPGWIVFAHAAVHDIYLSVAITLALVGYAIGFCSPECPSRSGPRLGAAWIGFWCGVGFLSKGLLGIGLPLLIIGADCALRRDTRRAFIRPIPLLHMATAVLLVISPWLAGLISGGHWEYLQGFLGFSNLQRATRVVDGHHQPLLFYLPVLLGLLWPWWPLLLTSLQQVWKRRRTWRQAQGLERLQQLAALWLLLGLVLFSAIPTKLSGYILPLLPAAVLLMVAAPRRPAWSLRLVALQLVLLSLALPGALIAAWQGALGDVGRDLLASLVVVTWLGLIGSLALVAALFGWRSRRELQSLAALVLSMLLLVCSLPALASPYRQLQQQPVLVLAQGAHRLRGPAHVLYVIGRPRYSVVPIADLPTIFGSPLRPASARPDSSFLNWKRHGRDREALVLGGCRSIEALEQNPSVRVSLLEQRRTFCLARLQRTTSPSHASADQPG